LRIAGDGRVTLRLACTQRLGGEGLVRSFIFPAAALSRWNGTPESVRITVDHADPVARERIVASSPDRGQGDAWPLEWQWSSVRLSDDVRIDLFDGDWWGDYSVARGAAADPEAGAADHMRLAGMLKELDQAHASDMGISGGSTLRGAAIIAEYHAAISAANSEEERAEAHRALLRLYLERAAGSGAATDLQAALVELRSAQELGDSADGDAELEATLVARLQSEARLAGQTEVAARYASESAERGLSAPLNDHSVMLSSALLAAEGGDHDAARSLLVQAFGPGADSLPDAPPPSIVLSEVTVRMLPGARETEIRLRGSGAEALRTELMSALAGMRGTAAELRGDGMALRIIYSSPGELTAAMKAVAAKIPERPELALVRAAFTPASLTWEDSGGLLRTVRVYSELVDLGPALDLWEDLAYRLEAEAGRIPEGFALGHDAAGVLRRVQRILWSRDAAAWRALGQASAAEYTIAPMGQKDVRAMRVQAGEARLMVSQDDSLPTQRYRLLALVSVPLLLTAVFLVRRNG
jgi:hypothetical protein